MLELQTEFENQASTVQPVLRDIHYVRILNLHILMHCISITYAKQCFSRVF